MSKVRGPAKSDGQGYYRVQQVLEKEIDNWIRPHVAHGSLKDKFKKQFPTLRDVYGATEDQVR